MQRKKLFKNVVVILQFYSLKWNTAGLLNMPGVDWMTFFDLER